MARVFVGIGSNIERERHIRAAVAELRERFSDVYLSPVYESRAVGFEGDNFYNLVAAMQTAMGPEDLVSALHAIESRFGRRRGGPRYAARTLDLDLLLYDDLVSGKEGMQLPREDVTRFAFVLCPLADIAGDLKHPVSGERYRDLWARFEQDGQALWRVDMDPG